MKNDYRKDRQQAPPPLPNQIRHWMRARELADPDLNALIEEQIISTSRKYLGDFRSRILLSLPTENKSVPSEFGRVPQAPLFDNAPNKGAFVFLEDVLVHPNDGAKERSERLRIGTWGKTYRPVSQPLLTGN